MSHFDSDRLLHDVVGRSGGYLRANRYVVTITPPEGLRYDSASIYRIGANCMAAGMPGRSFATAEYEQGGVAPMQQIPHMTMFRPYAVDFYVSADAVERKFFEEWAEMVQDIDTGQLEYIDNFAGSLTFEAYGRIAGQPPAVSFELEAAWPIDVGDVRMAYADQDQVAVLPVVFSFWKARRIRIDGERQTRFR